MSPTTSSSPRTSRSPCSRCSRRSRRPNARCSCCVRSSTCLTTRSPRRSTRRLRPCGRSPIAREPTWRRVIRASTSSARNMHQVVDRFLAALNTGDVQGLMDVLAPDVVAVADGGGQVRGAARRPIVGAERLVAYLMGGMAKFKVQLVGIPTWVNGAPAARIEVEGVLAAVVSLTVEDGRITRIYSIANPRSWSGSTPRRCSPGSVPVSRRASRGGRRPRPRSAGRRASPRGPTTPSRRRRAAPQ